MTSCVLWLHSDKNTNNRQIGNLMKKAEKILLKWIPILFFILLFCAAWILHDDYGGFTDELSEIEVAATNFQYILTKLGIPEKLPVIPTVNPDSLIGIQEYQYRYYGSAVMMPSLFVLLFPGKTINTAHFLNFRRFYTFLNFYLALICSFLLFRLRFQNQWIALLGVAMLVLSPRFFAESFYNGKDMIFFSWFLISLFGIGLYFFKRSTFGLFIFSAAFGLTVNTRNFGIILLPAFVALSVIDLLKNNNRNRKDWILIFCTCGASLLFYYLVTPFLWSDPIHNFLSSLQFSARQVGIGKAELFMGNFIAPKDTWYYIPVFYLALFLIRIISLMKNCITNKSQIRFSKPFLWDLFCFSILAVSIIGIVFLKAVIYHGWRHSYFLYGPFICLSVAGFFDLWNITFSIKKSNLVKNLLLLSICLISFLSTGFWMIKNHPFDFVYFNEIGRFFAQQFTRDYWGVASKSCIQEVDRHYVDGKPIRLGVNADLTYGSTQNSLLRFPEETQAHFQVIWKNENADYLCFSYKNIPGNSHSIPGFEIIKTFQVDGYDVAAVYRRIEKDLP